MNSVVNHLVANLDLIFSNTDYFPVNLSIENLVPIDKYHPASSLVLEFNNCNQRMDPGWFYNFKRGNYELMNHHLLEADWAQMYECNDINVAIDNFYKIIYCFIILP